MNTKDSILHKCSYEWKVAEKFQSQTYEKNSFANLLVSALTSYGYVPEKKGDRKNKKNAISEIDIYSLLNSNRYHISHMIKNFLQINKKEGLDYLNTVLSQSAAFFKGVLKWDIPEIFLGKRKKGENDDFFRNENDVIEFIISNSKENPEYKNLWTQEKQIICSMLKISHCINIKNQKADELEKAEDIFDDMSEMHIYPYFNNKENNEIDPKKMKGKVVRGWRNKYKKFQTISKKNPIKFRWSARIKDDDMIILKMLSNPEYWDVEAINDIYWKRNECENKKDAILLLQYHRINVFKRDPKTQFKIKDLFGKTEEETKDFVEKIKPQLDKWFWELFKKASQKKDDGKNWDAYEDAKLIWSLIDKEGKSHSVEIQFNLLNNKNEEHFSHHRIYKMKAIIEAIVRLQGYITKSHIERIIHEMLEEHRQICKQNSLFPELLYLGNNSDENNSKPAEAAIFNHLKEKNIIQNIQPNNNSERKDSIFTTTKYRDRMHHSEDNKAFYPEGLNIWND